MREREAYGERIFTMNKNMERASVQSSKAPRSRGTDTHTHTSTHREGREGEEGEGVLLQTT